MNAHVTPEIPAPVRILTRQIEYAPDVPVHYVLRGEEWLLVGALDRARADFERARELAEVLVIEGDWGYLLQAYLDRATSGLRRCGAGN